MFEKQTEFKIQIKKAQQNLLQSKDKGMLENKQHN